MAPLSVLAAKKLISFVLFLSASFATHEEKLQKAETKQGQAIKQETNLEGAWKLTSSTDKEAPAAKGSTAIRLMADGWFSVAVYDKEGKKFLGTYGGTYSIVNGKLTQRHEFNTFEPAKVGTAETSSSALRNTRLQLKAEGAGTTEIWEKIEKGKNKSPLAGAWRITEREGSNGQMSTMPAGARKTIKILSNNRFQWIAFNSETAEFSGTGGGTYTWQDGKYTENIEFFSRDNSRVGNQLTFNYEIKGNKWHHTGLSSTGNKVNEIWQRQPKQ